MADKPLIRHVFFDLGEVLIQGLRNSDRFLAGILSTRRENILPGLSKHLRLFMTAQMNEDEYWRQTLADNNWDADIILLKSFVRKHFEPQIPGAVDIVKQVANNYPVYLHSDIGREWMEYVRKYHKFLSLFKRLFSSYELGAVKRDIKAFARTTQEIGAQPQHCLLVDDWHKNVSSAKMIGLQVIKFQCASQLKQELIKLGVLT